MILTLPTLLTNASKQLFTEFTSEGPATTPLPFPQPLRDSKSRVHWSKIYYQATCASDPESCSFKWWESLLSAELQTSWTPCRMLKLNEQKLCTGGGAPWHPGDGEQHSPAQNELEPPDFWQELNCLASSIQPWGNAQKLPPLHRKPQNPILHGLCIHTRPGMGHTPFLCWTFQLLCVWKLLDSLQTADPRCCQRVWWGGVLPKTKTLEELNVSYCTCTLVIEKKKAVWSY